MISVILISAMGLILSSCRATERYMRALEAEEEQIPLICEKKFGSYRFDPGWIEVESESVDPYLYTYCPEEASDSSDSSYYMTVSCEPYDIDNLGQFSSDHYPLLAEKYGEESIEPGAYIVTDDDTGISMITFEITAPDVHIYQWNEFYDRYHVTFELTINDEEIALQDNIVDRASTTAWSLRYE